MKIKNNYFELLIFKCNKYEKNSILLDSRWEQSSLSSPNFSGTVLDEASFSQNSISSPNFSNVTAVDSKFFQDRFTGGQIGRDHLGDAKNRHYSRQKR